MTTQHLSDWDRLAETQRARRARLAVAPTVGAPASDAAEGRWLTAILRPAGSMDRTALHGLCGSLRHLASSSNMMIVDLTAAAVVKPGPFARDLLAPARQFERAGQCLLLLGASPELAAALDRYAVPVVTLAADSLPPEAA
jgi:hypothetical protein